MSAAKRLDVRGKTVFITGAARGIGAAVAERLHGRGANVALVGLEGDLLRERERQLGARALAIEVDVTDFTALQAAVAQTVERFGGVDVGIANAGISFSGPLRTAPIEQVERTFAVNLLGVWRTDRALIEELSKSRGYLLNVASLAAAFHAPLMGPYASTKAGVEALTDVLRIESAPSGVSVGCAYFGFIDTDIVRHSFAQPSARVLQSQMPSFIAKPAPLASAVTAIERGIERRSPRLWAPRWMGAVIALRTVFQPLTERRMFTESARIAEAMRAAEESGETSAHDPLLGVSVPRASDTPDADRK